MAGQSIGDLFVKLGFDVDDSKLKSFEDSLKGVFNTVLGLAGITASVGGFVKLSKDASDTALTIDNLTAKFGVSTQAIQAWAAALHEANPLQSRDAGIGSFGHFAEYLNNAATTTQGTMALNRLGVQWTADDRQHPEKAINKLFDTLPQLLKQHPEQRGLYSGLLDQLFGNVNSINVFERGRAAADAAALRGSNTPDEIAQQAEARKNLSELGNLWDQFIGHVVGSLAPAVSDIAKKTEKGGWWGFVDSVGEHSWLNDWIAKPVGSGVKAMVEDSDRARAKDSGLKGLQAFGWSADQSAAIMKRLMIESGMNPGAVGDGGQAYGIAQWHPDRQANFAKWAGHDIHGSSVNEQLEFLNYELTKGLERKAGDKLRATQNKDDAYRTFTNDYERPAVTVSVTQHITSNADEHEVARLSREGIQDTVTAAMLNRLGVDQ